MTIPEGNPKVRPLTKRIVTKTLLYFAATAALLFIWKSSIVRITKNFDEVDPGRFYRSAQLTPKELEAVIQKYGIKTVISLRGKPENSYWVKPQEKVLQKNGVAFHHFNWSVDHSPETAELKNYLQTLKTAQFPVLVHCRTGSDRTGEAAAMYAVDFLKQSKDEAIEKHLSPQYYHIKALHPAKAEFVRRYPGIEEALTSYDQCSEKFRDLAAPGHCS